MGNGLILLVLLAAVAAFGWARMRRRLGIAAPWRGWVGVMAVVILAILALWAYATHG